MKYVALVYMFGIAIYNLFGNNDILYWRFHYFFLSSLVLTFAFFELHVRALGRARLIYLAGFIFSLFYTVFELFAIKDGNIRNYLGKINSGLWSVVSFCLILFLFFMLYDKNMQRKNN